MDKCNCQIPNTDLMGRCFKCGGFIEIPTSNKKSPTTEERIKAEAIAHVIATRGQEGRVETYIAGATAENERAQVLVDALELAKKHINDLCLTIERLGCTPFNPLQEIETALQQWKGKEVENGA